MSEALDAAAQEYRAAKAEFNRAKLNFEVAKGDFERELRNEYGTGTKAAFVASDGFKYGRTLAEVGGGLDFERLKRENMSLAMMVGKLVVDGDAVERVCEVMPELLPEFQKYALPTEQVERLLPITKPKEPSE